MMIIVAYPGEVFAFKFVHDFALLNEFGCFNNLGFDELTEVFDSCFLSGG